jgi:hypothetical protein
MQPNPFISRDAPSRRCFHRPPGYRYVKASFDKSENHLTFGLSSGKSLFLFYVLALRVLQTLPSIYMAKADCIYVVDSNGIRKEPAEEFGQSLVNEECWCLVDSNNDLQTVPTKLLTLWSFIIQTTSPRGGFAMRLISVQGRHCTTTKMRVGKRNFGWTAESRVNPRNKTSIETVL